MNSEFLVMIILFALIIVPVILVVIINLFSNTGGNSNYSNGINNHDTTMREFVYKVNKTQDEILSELKNKHSDSKLKFEYNEKDELINFYTEYPDERIKVAYCFEIKEYVDFSILRVWRKNLFQERNMYMYYLNEFWHKKINAEPIPYFVDNYSS